VPDPDIWRFQAHPEVWLIIAVVAGLGLWVTRVIGPKVVPEGEVVTSRQRKCFVAAVGLLWLASDWPVHDISEEYLYFVHMAQHLVITLVIPPLVLLATPEWLARLIVSEDGTTGIWIRRLTRPVAAAFLFNILVAFTHITWVVNTSVANGVFHYLVHLTVFAAALLAWMPVFSPLPELRISYPGQMLYLFLNSVLPTIPGGFLTFAETALYDAYNHDVRLWGITVTDDQQAAGLIMKLLGGGYLWGVIGFKFKSYVKAERDKQAPRAIAARRARDADEAAALTYEQVQTAFEAAGDPVAEGR